MYKYFMNIRGYRSRHEQVKEDEKGLYIEVGINLFKENDRYYLDEKETKEYNKIIKHNEKVKNRQDAIEEAKKEGRYKKVEQIVKNGNKTGVYAYEYYDKQGKVI